MELSQPIYKLKRRAKKTARAQQIKLHVALDQIAADHGYQSWSHLAQVYAQHSPAKDAIKTLKAGDMVLVGARPQQGKTLWALELFARADHINRTGFVFSLDFNEADIWDSLGTLGFARTALDSRAQVDTSNDICAGYIIDRLQPVASRALIIIDYLQLLDQNRSTPPLKDQIASLKDFARTTGAIIVILAQIDRVFDLTPAGMPDINDIRLPNPVDLSLFNVRCFLHDGKTRIDIAA